MTAAIPVLWVANTVFPDAAQRLGWPAPVVGGWMYGLAADLAAQGDVRLAVASVHGGAELHDVDVGGVRHLLLPREAASAPGPASQALWREVARRVEPALAHVHGTEYAHGLAMLHALPQLPAAVSIQGLVSVYARHYMAGLEPLDILRSVSLRDLLRRDTLWQARRRFVDRGRTELAYLDRVRLAIGRTDWDHAHVHAHRPELPYAFCNESLRDEFYGAPEWTATGCRPHSIFLSQASYPIKGLHLALQAAALLRRSHPDLRIEIAGDDITAGATAAQRLRRGGYARHVLGLIDRFGLRPHVAFLGPLGAAAMREAYLRSNVFVCPSSIENSPNSIGEAQMLGVPVVATAVGGIPSMVGDSAQLLPFGEPEMLAEAIARLFDSAPQAAALGARGREAAQRRHDRAGNRDRLVQIYRSMLAGAAEPAA